MTDWKTLAILNRLKHSGPAQQITILLDVITKDIVKVMGKGLVVRSLTISSELVYQPMLAINKKS